MHRRRKPRDRVRLGKTYDHRHFREPGEVPNESRVVHARVWLHHHALDALEAAAFVDDHDLDSVVHRALYDHAEALRRRPAVRQAIAAREAHRQKIADYNKPAKRAARAKKTTKKRPPAKKAAKR